MFWFLFKALFLLRLSFKSNLVLNLFPNFKIILRKNILMLFWWFRNSTNRVILCCFQINNYLILLTWGLNREVLRRLGKVKVGSHELGLGVKLRILENLVVLVWRWVHLHVWRSESLEIVNICHCLLEAWLN